MRKFLLLTFFIVSLIFHPITIEVGFCQEGSIYSRFGIGEVILNSSSRRMGIGGLGIASLDKFDVNSYNPASWTAISTIKMLLSVKYNGYNSIDNFNSVYLSKLNFESFAFGVPIYKPLGISAVIGLSPYSKTNYSVLLSTYYDEIPYQAKYSGDGGINKLFVGASYKLPLDFSFGLNFNYYFGTIQNKSEVIFNSTDYFNSSYLKQEKHTGWNLDFGLISPDIKISNFWEFKSIKFALVYSPKFNLKTDATEIRTGVLRDTISKRFYDIHIPQRMTFGIHSSIGERVNLFVDQVLQNWASYKLDRQKDGNLKNLSQTSIGFELMPPSKPASFLQTLTWRLAFGYRDSEMSFQNQKIREIYSSFGFSFPFDPTNSIDFAFQFSHRGKKTDFLLEENIFRLQIGINLSEIWFVRTDD